MSPGDRDPLVGGQDTGAQLLAPGNLIPQPGIKIPQAPHRANGRHSAHHFGFGKIGRHAIGRRLQQGVAHQQLYQLGVVPLLLLGLSVPGQMYMHIDQTGHQISALYVHSGVSLRDLPLRHNAHDQFPLCQHRQSAARLHILSAV